MLQTARRYQFTIDVSEIERPQYAKRYAVGDRLRFKHPRTGEPLSAVVVGFGVGASEGKPVVLVPEELSEQLEDVTTLCIQERFVIEEVQESARRTSKQDIDNWVGGIEEPQESAGRSYKSNCGACGDLIGSSASYCPHCGAAQGESDE